LKSVVDRLERFHRMKGRRAGDPKARHAHARPMRDPGTFPARTMWQFGPWSASFRQQLVPTPGSHPPAPTRFSDTPDPRTRSSSRCTPVEPASGSCTYMGSAGLPGPAGPAKSVSRVSSSSSWRRSPDLLGFWRDRGAAGCRHDRCGTRPELFRDLYHPGQPGYRYFDLVVAGYAGTGT